MGLFWRAADPRSQADVESDIREELAFHIDACARELEREGMDAESARAEAQRRFGDVAEVQRACARVEIGERIMLQRVQFVLTVVLLIAVALLAWSSIRAEAQIRAQGEINQALLARLQQASGTIGALMAADNSAHRTVVIEHPVGLEGEILADDPVLKERNPEAWLDAFQRNPASWRLGLSLASKLAELPQDVGVDILLAIWSRIPEVQREQVMKPFVFDGGHPRALEVLHAGANDEGEVRRRAHFYLRRYAFRDLLVGEGTYDEWHLRNEGRSIADVLRASLRERADWISSGKSEQYDKSFDWVEDLDERIFVSAHLDLGRELIAAGISDAMANWERPPMDPLSLRGYEKLKRWIEAARNK